jgi:GT2 family glycosyltransferase
VARNAAARAALGDWVAFIDDDAVVEAGWLEGFARATRAHPDAGVLTGFVLPMVLDTDAQVLFEAGGGFRKGEFPIRFRGAERADDPLFPLGPGRFGVGCNMAVRRDVLAALGGFDPALDTGAPLPGGGDLDLFYRALRGGYPLVYEPGMAVRHEHRAGADRLRRQYHSWGLSFFAFLRKTWRAEPEQRPRVRAVSRWWWQYMVKRLATGRPLPRRMVAGEIVGGVRGMLGEYERSVRRMRQRRRAQDGGRVS